MDLKIKEYQDRFARKRGFKDYNEYHNHISSKQIKELHRTYVVKIAMKKLGLKRDEITEKIIADTRIYLKNKRKQIIINRIKRTKLNKKRQIKKELIKKGFKICLHCKKAKPFSEFKRLKCLEKRGQARPFSWKCIDCASKSRMKMPDLYIKSLIFSKTKKPKTLITKQEIKEKKNELKEKRIKWKRPIK